jgi:hypothetical protein
MYDALTRRKRLTVLLLPLDISLDFRISSPRNKNATVAKQLAGGRRVLVTQKVLNREGRS